MTPPPSHFLLFDFLTIVAAALGAAFLAIALHDRRRATKPPVCTRTVVRWGRRTAPRPLAPGEPLPRYWGVSHVDDYGRTWIRPLVIVTTRVSEAAAMRELAIRPRDLDA